MKKVSEKQTPHHDTVSARERIKRIEESALRLLKAIVERRKQRVKKLH